MDPQHPSLLFLFADKFFWRQAHHAPCDKFHATVIFCTAAEIFFLVSLSHLLHLVLKRLDQPSIVSQLLAGFLLGPTILGRLNLLNKDTTQITIFSAGACIFFMFLVGLEFDASYLQRTFHLAAMTTAGIMMLFVPLSIASGMFLHRLINSTGSIAVFVILIFLFFFNTGTPVVIRVLNDLKITMTEIGRVAISTALISNIVSLAILAALDFAGSGKHMYYNLGKRAMAGMTACSLLALTSVAIRTIARSANRGSTHKRAIEDDTVFYILLLVFIASGLMRRLGYDQMLAAFVFGLAIPRDGPTSRTLAEQLTYAVRNLILPVYFGVSALQVDVSFLKFKQVVIATLTVFVLGMIGKTGGTLIGAKCMGIPMRDGLLLSLVLNMKGLLNLMIIMLGKKYEVWSDRIHMALLITLFLDTLTSSLATAYIVRRERKMKRYRFQSLERLNPGSELRILACIHSPGEVPTILDLIEMSTGTNKRLHLAPYILHLMETMSNDASKTVFTRQLHLLDNDYSGNFVGGNNMEQVNVAIDTFVRETGIHLRQRTAFSRYDTMHVDLEFAVHEVHASLAIVPFHSKKRFDGKMGAGKEEIRKFNVNVLRHVPCSIGVLVDRGWETGHKLDGAEDGSSRLHVVVLFLGGPDDREAAAYAARLALHPSVNVTLMRFLPTSRQGDASSRCRNNNVANGSSRVVVEVQGTDKDEIFMASFYQRFVATGVITYLERLVKNSKELITTLSSMERMYSLYIMGRQIQGPAQQLIVGLGEWEDSPELGPVGDLLASSDFMLYGSVLVIQQHNITS